MLSLNARGIRSPEKRQALLIWLQKQKVDITFLQETYRTEEVENNWKRQWKGPMFFAHGSNHSCAQQIRGCKLTPREIYINTELVLS